MVNVEIFVAIGTGLLAVATFWSVLQSKRFERDTYEERRRERDRSLAKYRLDDFYSPLLKIFTANRESIMGEETVKSRANELVETLKGKRYLAKLTTLNKIPKNVEQVAYSNWSFAGYLCFNGEEELKNWKDFADQLWVDYVSLVNEFYGKEESQGTRPEWDFRVSHWKSL